MPPETLDSDDGSDSDPNKLVAPLEFLDGTKLDPLIAAFQAEMTAQGATLAIVNKALPIVEGILKAAAGATPMGPVVSAVLSALPTQI